MDRRTDISIGRTIGPSDRRARRVVTSAGYVDLTTGKRYWYVTNRQGSTMAVVDETGAVVQRNGYYPSGTPYVLPSETDAPSLTAVTDRLHIGNRWLSHSGLNWYDNTARMHDPLLMRFGAPDPLWQKYPGFSPWSHCAANPANAVDPTGKSTKVVASGNNTYEVIGGELDNDTNIYLYQIDKDGNYVKGESIGMTLLATSFYNSDANEWKEGVIIDTKDQSGIKFLSHIIEDTPSLATYIPNARAGHKYDFKTTNQYFGYFLRVC